MKFATLWPLLKPETREWLVEHNGEPLAPAIAEDLIDNNRGSTSDWLAEDAGEGATLDDSTVDWIEAVANLEDPAEA